MLFTVEKKLVRKIALRGEDGKPLEVPAHMLPKNVKVGDTLLYEKGKFTPAPTKAAERRQTMSDALSMLLRRSDD